MSWWPFGRKKNSPKLPPEVAQIFERITHFLEDESAQNSALPDEFRRAVMQNAPCDQVANGFGEFGRALTNPVPVNGLFGELLYLSRLETAAGVPLAFHRLGSHEAVDIFELVSMDGQHWDLLYLSFYYPRKSRIIPAGLRKKPDLKRSSQIWGTNDFVRGFPSGIFRASLEYTDGLIGMAISDPQLKSFDEDGFVRPERHLRALRQLSFSS